MKKKRYGRYDFWRIVGWVIVVVCFFPYLTGVIRNLPRYTVPVYTDAYFSRLAGLFNHSQYRQKQNPSIIPDETVFSYAAGAYVRGTDPILINSEHTPLAKYIIGLGILLFRNDSVMIPIFSVIFLLAVWLIAQSIMGRTVWALIPVALFAREPLFLNQLRYTPLLDIIHVPFILLTVWAYLKELGHGRFILTALFLGLTAATKTLVPAVILLGVMSVHLFLVRRMSIILRLGAYLPISLVTFIASYTKTFLDGYSLRQFLGFQKWIFLYQQSKLIYPLSFWKLIYTNRWQAWWGDKSILHASDWQITWPVAITVILLVGIAALIKRVKPDDISLFLLLYSVAWLAFLSLGAISTRFFLPLLPVAYIVTVWFVILGCRKLAAVGKTRRATR